MRRAPLSSTSSTRGLEAAARPALDSPPSPPPARVLRFAAFVVTSAASHGALLLALARVPAAPPIGPPADPAPALAGDTFDLSGLDDEGPSVDAPAMGDVRPFDLAPLTPPPPDSLAAAAPLPSATPNPPRPTGARAVHAARPVSSGRAFQGERGAALPSVPYGAVGERGAADLTTAFTRAFPHATSADPTWTTVPFGDAGGADVTLTIDQNGKLTGAAVSPGGSPALRAGIARTVALIRGRVFVARAATTRLHVTARVAPDHVHDGLHGDVFALGGSFAGAEGDAFFALPIGRRVDVRIRLE